KAFTDRQHAYASAWRSDTVYTPCFVLNGKEWRGWSHSIPASTSNPGVLKITSADLKAWDVTFSPRVPLDQAYEAHAALLLSGLTSDVKAGENKGRHLDHDFVVTRVFPCVLKSDVTKLQGRFELKLANGEPAKNSALVVWVTRPHNPEPLQATGGWL